MTATFPAGGVRFTIAALPGLVFVQYPASVIPPDRTMAFVQGSRGQRAAIFRDGRWFTMRGHLIKNQPERYTVFEGREHV
jgi:hypothetical protein